MIRKEEETDWLAILDALDEWGRPAAKLPTCPACYEDELGVIYADLIQCYACGWRFER